MFVLLIMKVTNKMQQYKLFYYSQSAVHVLGGVFAHRQENLTVFTVSSIIRPISPDDGRKHRPKHVELTRNNKITCIVVSC
jgi:hypothetical protein